MARRARPGSVARARCADSLMRTVCTDREVAMASTPTPAARLAAYLRKLREQAGLTQADLAKAFSGEKRVAAATVSSWESLTALKTPTALRLNAYARFFATPRSLTPGPHLIPLEELEVDELER